MPHPHNPSSCPEFISGLFQDLSNALRPLVIVKEHEEIPEQVRNDGKGVLGKFVIRSKHHVAMKKIGMTLLTQITQ